MEPYMNSLKILMSTSLIALLTACASAPPLQQPLQISTATNFELFRAPLLDQTNHTVQHLDDSKEILYYQTYGGGGVGLGLLAGPLGVLANVKMIEGNTMKDVAILKNKITLNPKNIFLAAANKTNIAIKSDKALSNTKLSPYLLIEKTEGDKLMLASVIIAEVPNSKPTYPNKYLVQLPITYNIQELSTLDSTKTQQLAALAEKGFETLLQRIKLDSTTNVIAEQKITLQSEFLTPRFKFDMQGSLIEKSDSLTWVRVIGCVCGVNDKDITYKTVKK